MRNYAIAIVVSLLVVCPQVQAQSGWQSGEAVSIREVFVDDASDPMTILIVGEELLYGKGPLSVTLGAFPDPLTLVGTPTDTEIVATLPENILNGEYLLVVSNGRAPRQYDEFDLTIGSIDLPGVRCPCDEYFSRAVAKYVGYGGRLENIGPNHCGEGTTIGGEFAVAQYAYDGISLRLVAEDFYNFEEPPPQTQIEGYCAAYFDGTSRGPNIEPYNRVIGIRREAGNSNWPITGGEASTTFLTDQELSACHESILDFCTNDDATDGEVLD